MATHMRSQCRELRSQGGGNVDKDFKHSLEMDGRFRHRADSYAIGRLRRASRSADRYTNPTDACAPDRYANPTNTCSANSNTAPITG